MPWTPRYLHAVQRRREWPTRVTQAIQVFVQNRVIAHALASTQTPKPPLAAKMLELGAVAAPHSRAVLGLRHTTPSIIRRLRSRRDRS